MCNLHRWSNKGLWQECCYKKEVNNKKCIQEKPLELFKHSRLGREIGNHSWNHKRLLLNRHHIFGTKFFQPTVSSKLQDRRKKI
jgi:hypothetical protein